MKTIRTFVAAEIPPSLEKRVRELIGLLRAGDADVKWVAPGTVHLTFKFLGNVPNVEIPDVCRAVESACQEMDPISVKLAGAGAFPDAQRARTVWVGVQEGAEALVQLQSRIDAALAKIGFVPERRRFHPHLTIGRLRRGSSDPDQLAELIQQHADFAVGTMYVDEVVVFASSLDRSGPSYDALARVPFPD
jgi:RNA 2',3'-cyclic 3'-phosphodiesterase